MAARRGYFCRSTPSSRSRTAPRSRPATCSPVFRARVLEDPRHHRRSAARRGIVRGAQAEGFRDHQRDRRPDRIRQGLQDQAPHADRAPEEGAEPVEYLIPKGKHISVQEGDFVQKGDLADRRQSGAARHPARHGHRGAGELSHQRDPGGLSPPGRAASTTSTSR